MSLKSGSVFYNKAINWWLNLKKATPIESIETAKIHKSRKFSKKMNKRRKKSDTYHPRIDALVS